MSFKILDLVEKGKIKGFCSAMTIPILWYLQKDKKRARQLIKEITLDCQVIDLTEKIIKKVLDKKHFGDLEDELQYLMAKEAGCSFLVTRNIVDFKKVKDIKILLPEDFLKLLS